MITLVLLYLVAGFATLHLGERYRPQSVPLTTAALVLLIWPITWVYSFYQVHKIWATNPIRHLFLILVELVLVTTFYLIVQLLITPHLP